MIDESKEIIGGKTHHSTTVCLFVCLYIFVYVGHDERQRQHTKVKGDTDEHSSTRNSTSETSQLGCGQLQR